MTARSTIAEPGARCAASLATPIGTIIVVACEGAIESVEFMDRGTPSGSSIAERSSLAAPRELREAVAQLHAYFAGELREFNLPLATRGTPFQRRVLAAVRAIPFGRTATYGDLARRLGDAGASRAVGAANARNPWPIVVPCHRVVGAAGRLTGYGGGLWRKEWLLGHESAIVGAVLVSSRTSRL
ncbi:MAG: methylated-DNA--[protein]-cysteine S-methyltransferase [Phycisphaerales bacterium]|nr:methylated-DNA--[protein]-cysteine S-methyltransferase [Phycisphaerales bacterium]